MVFRTAMSGVLVGVTVLSAGATDVGFPGLIGKYDCQTYHSVFVHGEYGYDPEPLPPSQRFPKDNTGRVLNAEGPSYFMEIELVDPSGPNSTECQKAIFSLEKSVQRSPAASDDFWIGETGIARYQFGWQCLSRVKMTLRTIGTFPRVTEFREYSLIAWNPNLYDDKIARIYFRDKEANETFLFRSDLTYIKELMSWNGGVDTEKGVCSRFKN